ncbi:MAG: hypothetical protein IJ995_05670 [Clostridia bacterium]|nr:hypothetical protein [Clostridia bacterium]
MSLLYGNIDPNNIFPIPMPYGEPMENVFHIEESSTAVAAVDETTLLCGGQGSLTLYHIHSDGTAEKRSALKIFGNARQISVCDGFAYISARESGVLICDLTDLNAPKLAYQIDTLELATGIAAADGVLAITNRHMGCELYDVRDPYQPRRLGDFHCGEAQSVYLYKNFAVISHWIGREAAVFDISDPADAKKLSTLSVDGFADGVCVIEHKEKTLCLVGTGHHATRLQNRHKYNKFTYATAEMIAEGYGCGHGVEIFDITDPRNPNHISTLKTPPHFGGPDTWLTYSDGETCVFTDSMNGIFTIDLSDLQFTGHYRLAPTAQQKMSPPSIQVQTAAVTDAASVGGYLCAACGGEGVHILKPNQPIGAFSSPTASVNFEPEHAEGSAFYRSAGQIHNFAEYDGKVYCASGERGIEVLDTKGTFLYRKETQGICHDLCLHQGKLYTAEGDCGVACYALTQPLTECARATVSGCVRQIIEAVEDLPVQVGCRAILYLNSALQIKSEAKAAPLYHRHLSRTLAGRYAIAMPLSKGPALLDAENELEKVAVFGINACPFEDGACGCGDKLIFLFRGKYLCLDDPKDLSKQTEGIAVDGALLSGIPHVLGETLVILNRYAGTVELLDISDVHHPKFIKRIQTDGHPEACGLIGGELYVCLGHKGIIKL